MISVLTKINPIEINAIIKTVYKKALFYFKLFLETSSAAKRSKLNNIINFTEKKIYKKKTGFHADVQQMNG